VITQKLELENKYYDFEEEVIVTAGSIEAITATMLAILSPGDEVLVPDPPAPLGLCRLSYRCQPTRLPSERNAPPV